MFVNGGLVGKISLVHLYHPLKGVAVVQRAQRPAQLVPCISVWFFRIFGFWLNIYSRGLFLINPMICSKLASNLQPTVIIGVNLRIHAVP
jgi:hypothetical protein